MFYRQVTMQATNSNVKVNIGFLLSLSIVKCLPTYTYKGKFYTSY